MSSSKKTNIKGDFYEGKEYFLWADIENDTENENDNGMASVWEIGVTLLEIILEQMVEELE